MEQEPATSGFRDESQELRHVTSKQRGQLAGPLVETSNARQNACERASSKLPHTFHSKLVDTRRCGDNTLPDFALAARARALLGRAVRGRAARLYQHRQRILSIRRRRSEPRTGVHNQEHLGWKEESSQELEVQPLSRRCEVKQGNDIF